jgi:xanthine dehydrogenase molybdopterin-binding subunit B
MFVHHLQIASMNLYKEGDKTHFNQPLEHCTLQRCWDECLERADYVSRKKQLEEFNRYVHTLHNKDIYMCVCVCVCVRERERDILDVFWTYTLSS